VELEGLRPPDSAKVAFTCHEPTWSTVTESEYEPSEPVYTVLVKLSPSGFLYASFTSAEGV
jgi:hypothetical protein